MASPYHLVLFDDEYREALLPLAWTRPVADFRIGIYSNRERWEKYLKSTSTTHTVHYLAEWQYPYQPSETQDNLWINSRVVANHELVLEIMSLKEGEALIISETLVACNNGKNTEPLPIGQKDHLYGNFAVKTARSSAILIKRIHDLFLQNGKVIREDFQLLKGRESQPLSATNTIFGSSELFVGKNVKAEACVINLTAGPVYIGDNVELMEGTTIRGPFAIGEGAQLKMSTKIYGDTTIGPGCKIGGEVTNCVIFGNTNKAHDGFIGNSVLGEWCNLGADTNSSNLKNNYGAVEVYNYAAGGNENTGLQFHGLIMGDHSKCGINTMFNTGTVTGICSNIFGAGFPQKFIPDFSWGGAEGFSEYRLEKAFETIERVYERRSRKLSAEEKAVLEHVFKVTSGLRNPA